MSDPGHHTPHSRRRRSLRDILPALALTVVAGWLLAAGVRDGAETWRLTMTGVGFVIFAGITLGIARAVWRERNEASPSDDRR